MKRIWAPWRIEYIRKKDEKGCIFCDKPKMNDRNELILSRGESVFTLMNLYSSLFAIFVLLQYFYE